MKDKSESHKNASPTIGAESAELGFQLKNVLSIGAYFAKNQKHMLHQTLPEHLNTLLKEKGLKRADVVRGSLLDRAYVYQIFSGEKTPSRDKLIAIAFGLHLSDEETQKMLKLSGNRELYVRDKRDALILFSIQRGKDIFDTNFLLDDYGFPPLGAE